MDELTTESSRQLSLVRDRISEMPPLSTTVTKVLEICNDPKTSPHDLNRIISLDPVLTGRVLRMINSTYYSLPSQVNSLTRAIIMLGLNTVVNLASSTAIMKNVSSKDSFQALSMDDFWTHSICVGVMAKLLAGIVGVPANLQEEYFVAGLLHDLGKIPLNSCFSEDYLRAMEMAGPDRTSLLQAEAVILEMDHCMVGKLIADNWCLGPVLSDSLCHHHDPDGAMAENHQVIALVALGNIYANMAKIGSSGDSFVDRELAAHLLLQVDIGWDAVKRLHKQVLDEIDRAMIFLQVSSRSDA